MPLDTQAPAPNAPDSPDAEGIPCRRCGYELAGLSPAMSCPECGGRVSRMRHRWLHLASPAHLRRLRLGAAILSTHAAFSASANAFGTWAWATGGGLWLYLSDAWTALFLLSIALFVLGWWLVSRRDIGLQDARARRLRITLRASLAVCIVSTTVLFLTGSIIASDSAATTRYAAEMLVVITGLVLLGRATRGMPGPAPDAWRRAVLIVGVIAHALLVGRGLLLMAGHLGVKFDSVGTFVILVQTLQFRLFMNAWDIAFAAYLLYLLLSIHRITGRATRIGPPRVTSPIGRGEPSA